MDSKGKVFVLEGPGAQSSRSACSMQSGNNNFVDAAQKALLGVCSALFVCAFSAEIGTELSVAKRHALESFNELLEFQTTCLLVSLLLLERLVGLLSGMK